MVTFHRSAFLLFLFSFSSDFFFCFFFHFSFLTYPGTILKHTHTHNWREKHTIRTLKRCPICYFKAIFDVGKFMFSVDFHNWMLSNNNRKMLDIISLKMDGKSERRWKTNKRERERANDRKKMRGVPIRWSHNKRHIMTIFILIIRVFINSCSCRFSSKWRECREFKIDFAFQWSFQMKKKKRLKCDCYKLNGSQLSFCQTGKSTRIANVRFLCSFHRFDRCGVKHKQRTHDKWKRKFEIFSERRKRSNKRVASNLSC